MRNAAFLVLALPALLAGPVTPAQALCIYRGVDNVRTTLPQEFRDARWVVRARVIWGDAHWSDEGESWSLYRLAVVHTYKGSPLRRFTFFTARNSGGFYLDGEGGVPDLGGEYLLFLNLDRWPHSRPRAARHALWVNYNCGQSRRWAQVSAIDRRRLDILAASGRAERRRR